MKGYEVSGVHAHAFAPATLELLAFHVMVHLNRTADEDAKNPGGHESAQYKKGSGHLGLQGLR